MLNTDQVRAEEIIDQGAKIKKSYNVKPQYESREWWKEKASTS